jgi:hypothetical protein
MDEQTPRSNRIFLPNTLKTLGYIVSTASVILLGMVSWKAASESALLMVCLIVGAGASICGMLLRWISYQLDE